VVVEEEVWTKQNPAVVVAVDDSALMARMDLVIVVQEAVQCIHSEYASQVQPLEKTALELTLDSTGQLHPLWWKTLPLSTD
jgi:hypothetical protein